jgi:hypothetical protein
MSMIVGNTPEQLKLILSMPLPNVGHGASCMLTTLISGADGFSVSAGPRYYHGRRHNPHPWEIG